MNAASFIAGDWGATHLRLFLCDEGGEQIDTVVGPGAKEARGNFASIYDSLISPWTERWGVLTAILCGMVGSSIGWRHTRYVPCPATAQQIARSCVELRSGEICIVPGLSGCNRFGAPDLMRGEETQALGALALCPDLREGRHLLCAPGTHTKWIVIDDGAIIEMLTAPTGELFSSIRDHSVLIEDRSPADTAAGDIAFKRGLAEFVRYPRAQLLHRLFECRSRRLVDDLAANESVSYLSGLLIASDVMGALEVFIADTQLVHVIGSHELRDLYGQALASLGREVRDLDGQAAARTGLVHVRRLRTDR